jgi:hypothetical protein
MQSDSNKMLDKMLELRAFGGPVSGNGGPWRPLSGVVDGKPSGWRSDVASDRYRPVDRGGGCLVLDDVSGDDNAVLDGVGAGIGIDRAARLERA